MKRRCRVKLRNARSKAGSSSSSHSVRLVGCGCPWCWCVGGVGGWRGGCPCRGSCGGLVEFWVGGSRYLGDRRHGCSAAVFACGGQPGGRSGSGVVGGGVGFSPGGGCVAARGEVGCPNDGWCCAAHGECDQSRRFAEGRGGSGDGSSRPGGLGDVAAGQHSAGLRR